MPWKTLVVAVAVFGSGALAVSAHAADRTLAGRLGLTGQKYLGPQTRMSQAGITRSLTNRLLLQLMYERTGYAPMMPFDHDNGIMTGINLAF
jgi:hypothetical protein